MTALPPDAVALEDQSTNPIQSCCQSLTADHRQTEADLEAIDQALKRLNNPINTDLEPIKTLVHTLQQGLLQHYACETHGLFPILNMYRPMVLLEKEHQLLEDSYTLLKEALENYPQTPWETLLNAWTSFKTQLNHHILQEDRAIFPLADRVLEPEEKALVMRKIEEIRNALTEDSPLLQTFPEATRPPTLSTVAQDRHPTPETPLTLDFLMDAEHTQIQWITFNPNEQFQPHWAEQTHGIFLVEGSVEIQTVSKHPGLETTVALTPLQFLEIPPRTTYQLKALTLSKLLLVKVWPKPYFCRSSASS